MKSESIKENLEEHQEELSSVTDMPEADVYALYGREKASVVKELKGIIHDLEYDLEGAEAKESGTIEFRDWEGDYHERMYKSVI